MLREDIIEAVLLKPFAECTAYAVLPFHEKYSAVIDNNYISAVSEADASKKPPSARGQGDFVMAIIVCKTMSNWEKNRASP